MAESLSENGSRRREEADFRTAVGARVRLVTSAATGEGHFQTSSNGLEGEPKRAAKEILRFTCDTICLIENCVAKIGLEERLEERLQFSRELRDSTKRPCKTGFPS
jgi:hypothetical protein